jgi:hypothetical protein
MKSQSLFIFLGIFLLSLNLAQAIIQIEIDVKPIFQIGENIEFNYSLTSNMNELVRYLASVNCPDAPQSLLDLKTIQLQANQKVLKNYSYLLLDSNVKPQTCTASVSIQEPYKLTITKPFVIATTPSFSFNVYSCKDSACNEKAKVFLKNENIYFDYSSSVENPSLVAKITYPDKTTKQITLPTSIKANQIGSYALDVTASKAGYQTQTQNYQFGVIAKEAMITAANFTEEQQNLNNNNNTPLTKDYQNLKYYLIGGLLILIIIFIIIILLVRRKNQLE